MSEHFNKLSPAEAELLALLAEECGEVIQMIGKVLRHGLDSYPPGGGESNRVQLADEAGQVLAAIHLLTERGVLSDVEVGCGKAGKLQRVFKYLHHAEKLP